MNGIQLAIRVLLQVGLVVGTLCLLAACAQTQRAEVDAPQLSAALRWVGTCAVLCSALAGTALVIASRNRRK